VGGGSGKSSKMWKWKWKKEVELGRYNKAGSEENVAREENEGWAVELEVDVSGHASGKGSG
jgi:hypothetical protein